MNKLSVVGLLSVLLTTSSLAEQSERVVLPPEDEMLVKNLCSARSTMAKALYQTSATGLSYEEYIVVVNPDRKIEQLALDAYEAYHANQPAQEFLKTQYIQCLITARKAMQEGNLNPF